MKPYLLNVVICMLLLCDTRAQMLADASAKFSTNFNVSGNSTVLRTKFDAVVERFNNNEVIIDFKPLSSVAIEQYYIERKLEDGAYKRIGLKIISNANGNKACDFNSINKTATYRIVGACTNGKLYVSQEFEIEEPDELYQINMSSIDSKGKFNITIETNEKGKKADIRLINSTDNSIIKSKEIKLNAFQTVSMDANNTSSKSNFIVQIVIDKKIFRYEIMK